MPIEPKPNAEPVPAEAAPEKHQKLWTCPTCGTEKEKGFNKDSTKRLMKFSWKDMWVWAVLILILLTYYGYRQMQAELDAWKNEILGDCHGFCNKLESQQALQGLDNFTGLDFSKIQLNMNTGG